jgi:hypothetical protein
MSVEMILAIGYDPALAPDRVQVTTGAESNPRLA